MIVAMFHVEVSPGNEERFVEGFRHRLRLVDQMPGFRGFELVRHRDEPNKFIVITCWERIEDFLAWTQSEAFQQAHARAGTPTISTQLHLYEVVLSG